MKIPLDEIEDAFLFVSSDMQFSNRALLNKDTGEIYYLSDVCESDELPDDAEESDRYIEIPHKNDLDLGTELVHAFISQRAPQLADEVARIFRRKGAYSRFKGLLESHGLLQDWYDFENTQTQLALREWCRENDLDVSEQ